MRKRMIDPEFWSDEKIGNLHANARLMFIGMWNFADDEGIIKSRAEFLKSNIFPYDEIKTDEIIKWFQELVREGLIFSYNIAGQNYAIILNFKKHQIINKPTPSKLPAPSIQNKEYQRAIFKRDNWTCHICGEYLENKLVSIDGLDNTASIDHIIPISKGGNNLPNNLITACLKCNKGRGNKPLREDYGSSKVGLPPEVNISKEKISKDKLSKNNINIGKASPKFKKLEEDKKQLIQKLSASDISQAWQNKALLMASYLHLKLDDQSLKARWFDFFKRNQNSAVDMTVSNVKDAPTFLSLTNLEHKIKYFFAVYYGKIRPS